MVYWCWFIGVEVEQETSAPPPKKILDPPPTTIEKIIRENAFEEKKKKPGIKFNPRLVLIGVHTTGPSTICKIPSFNRALKAAQTFPFAV